MLVAYKGPHQVREIRSKDFADAGFEGLSTMTWTRGTDIPIEMPDAAAAWLTGIESDFKIVNKEKATEEVAKK